MILYRDYLSSKFLNQKHKFYLRFEVLDRSYDTGLLQKFLKERNLNQKSTLANLTVTRNAYHAVFLMFGFT